MYANALHWACAYDVRICLIWQCGKLTNYLIWWMPKINASYTETNLAVSIPCHYAYLYDSY